MVILVVVVMVVMMVMDVDVDIGGCGDDYGGSNTKFEILGVE